MRGSLANGASESASATLQIMAERALLPEGIEQGRRRVREQHQVAALRALEPGDARAVEGHPPTERLLVEARRRDRDVVPRAEQIDEAQVDHRDVLLASESDEVFHGAHDSRPLGGTGTEDHLSHCRQRASAATRAGSSAGADGSKPSVVSASQPRPASADAAAVPSSAPTRAGAARQRSPRRASARAAGEPRGQGPAADHGEQGVAHGSRVGAARQQGHGLVAAVRRQRRGGREQALAPGPRPLRGPPPCRQTRRSSPSR